MYVVSSVLPSSFKVFFMAFTFVCDRSFRVSAVLMNDYFHVLKILLQVLAMSRSRQSSTESQRVGVSRLILSRQSASDRRWFPGYIRVEMMKFKCSAIWISWGGMMLDATMKNSYARILFAMENNKTGESSIPSEVSTWKVPDNTTTYDVLFARSSSIRLNS